MNCVYAVYPDAGVYICADRTRYKTRSCDLLATHYNQKFWQNYDIQVFLQVSAHRSLQAHLKSEPWLLRHQVSKM